MYFILECWLIARAAYQEAERAKFIVEKAQQEKLQFIAKAEGEARAAKMISDVIQSNPYYLEVRESFFFLLLLLCMIW